MPTDVKRTIEIINEISPSFCAAKWYNATIWLGNGRTASCHLPPAHSISVSEIMKNPSALHNTAFKKDRRLEMLTGKRSDECAYCWTVEDNAEPNIYSDRVYKTRIYQETEILQLSKLDPQADIDPKTLTVEKAKEIVDNNMKNRFSKGRFNKKTDNTTTVKGETGIKRKPKTKK